MRVRTVLGLLAGASLLVAACGGGGGKSAEEKARDEANQAREELERAIDEGSLPDLDPGKTEFEEVDGATIRFANLYAADGEGQSIDVYWGFDAESGEKVTTLEYGEVSDYFPAMTAANPLVEPENDEGESEVTVSYYLEGETDDDARLMNTGEPVMADEQFTWVLGWQDSGGTAGASHQVVFEEYREEDGRVPEPPAGKALLALVDIGVQGIDGGDFVTFDEGNDCTEGETADVLGNVSGAITVDPGPIEVRAFDANQSCASGTQSVSIDVAAGDRWLILAYGTTKEDRALVAAKMD